MIEDDEALPEPLSRARRADRQVNAERARIRAGIEAAKRAGVATHLLEQRERLIENRINMLRTLR